MKTSTILVSLLVLTIIVGCKSQQLDNAFYFHKDINKENYRQMLSTAKLPDGDSLWINDRTVCIKDKNKYFRVGSIANGRKKGRWYSYYYHEKSDSLDCYVIENFTRKDSSFVHAVSINRRDW